MIRFLCTTLLLVSAVPAAELPEQFDVVIKNGPVYDGTGSEGRKADVAIRGDRIVGVGDFQNSSATNVIDAHDLAVAPGFIRDEGSVDSAAAPRPARAAAPEARE